MIPIVVDLLRKLQSAGIVYATHPIDRGDFNIACSLISYGLADLAYSLRRTKFCVIHDVSLRVESYLAEYFGRRILISELRELNTDDRVRHDVDCVGHWRRCAVEWWR